MTDRIGTATSSMISYAINGEETDWLAREAWINSRFADNSRKDSSGELSIFIFVIVVKYHPKTGGDPKYCAKVDCEVQKLHSQKTEGLLRELLWGTIFSVESGKTPCIKIGYNFGFQADNPNPEKK